MSMQKSKRQLCFSYTIIIVSVFLRMPEYTYTLKLTFFRQKGKNSGLINKACGKKYFKIRSTSAMHCFQVAGVFWRFFSGSLSLVCELKHWASAATSRIFLKNVSQQTCEN